jgi:hypothetical protein
VRNYIFVDESGDPGLDGNPRYMLVGMQMDEDGLTRFRQHLTAFRYHHEVVKELKAQRFADKLSPQARHLLDFLADLTDDGYIASTATWLEKEKYRKGGGPYLAKTGTTWQFRHFQLRLLLERHVSHVTWAAETDLVIDRWKMSLDQRGNLEQYLRGNYNLRPVFANITTVDSVYCDPIQVVDIYGRLLRRVVEGGAEADESALAHRLMEIHEIKGGIYAGA